MILHCMKRDTWEKVKRHKLFGDEYIKSDGFVHCSPVEYFWRVAPNFRDIGEELVLLCIDEKKLSAEVKYEDGDQCGRFYPHVYGLIENDAVTMVLPFLRDHEGTWVKNEELAHIPDS